MICGATIMLHHIFLFFERRKKMVKITYRSNISNFEKIVDGSMTVNEFLDENGGYDGATLSLNGSILSPAAFDTSFIDLGVTEKAQLLEIVKANNA